MKVLLSLILFTLIAFQIKAQTAYASINITFTDIHSIKIAAIEPASTSLEKSKNLSTIKNISIFSSKGSQIKKFNSKTNKTEILYLDSQPIPGVDSSGRFYAGNSKIIHSIQGLNNNLYNNPLIVYQIDPR